MTAEWEEGELSGHRPPRQASSLLLFLLVMEPKGRREKTPHSTLSIPFDKEVNPV